MRFILALSLLLATLAHTASAQTAVYLIRHAEKERGNDPALTPAGRERASKWAAMLQHAGLDAVITSDARRTRETGSIIAAALGLPETALPVADTAGLLDALTFDHEEDTVLVVGHAETIPGILASLGVLDDITISQSEFANLFIVAGPASGNPTFIRLQMP